MATSIKAKCLNCGKEVFLAPKDVVLIDYPDRSTYSFRCVLCNSHSTKDAPPAVASLLVEGGVARRPAIPTSRPTIEGKAPCGPPIDIEDLARFHAEIEAI